MTVEDHKVSVVDAELREAPGHRLGVDHLVVEAVLGDDVDDGTHLRVVGRPHDQGSGQPPQLPAGLRLQLLPEKVGVPDERHIAAVVGLHAAEDPGLTARGAAVVAGGEAVIRHDLGAPCRQSPGGLAAHRAGTDDGDPFPCS